MFSFVVRRMYHLFYYKTFYLGGFSIEKSIYFTAYEW